MMIRFRAPKWLLRAVTLFAIVTSTIVVSTPAFATDNVLYPSGCRQVTVNSWQPSCWVGCSYVKISTSVMAVQYVLKDTGHDPGVIDRDFGSHTDQATIDYQRDYGLTADGIVGGQTWASLQGRLVFSGIGDTYGYYYNVGIDGLRFYWEGLITGPISGTWFVRDPYYYLYPNAYVAVAGPRIEERCRFLPIEGSRRRR